MTGHLKGEWGNKEGRQRGLSRVREVKNYKKQERRVPSVFVNWHLSKSGSWSPTEAGRETGALSLGVGWNKQKILLAALSFLRQVFSESP